MALSYDHLFADLGEIVEVIDDFLEFTDGRATEVLTSGTLEVGVAYVLTDWIAADDFLNVGAKTNGDGVGFIATGTTPTAWAASSVVNRIGVDLLNMEDEIGDEFVDESDLGDGILLPARRDVLSGIPEMFLQFKETVLGWISSLGEKATQRLLNYDTVLAEMALLKSVSIETLLTELYRKMVDDAETLDRSTVTLNPNGAITSIDGNGDGVLFNNKKLDGYNSPSAGWPIIVDYAQDLSNAAGAGRLPGEHADYAGTDTELGVVSETMTLTCVADSETTGTAEGAESFEWTGEEGSESYNWEAEGSGSGPQVTVANGSGMLTDGEMENFTVADTPDSWDLDLGTAGTHIFEEDAAHYHRGTSSLKFFGVAAFATHQVSQTISGLEPLRRYFIGAWVKTSGAGVAAGALTIQFEGTGYLAGDTEKIDMNTAALTAQVLFTTTNRHFFVTMPAIIPSDMELVIKVTGTLTAGESVYIDGVCLAPAVYHGGVALGIMAGNAPFIIGDRTTFTVANNDRLTAGGTFQRFFRKFYRLQLPSVAAGETILDSLAE